MLDFWVLEPEEKMKMVEGALEGNLERGPDFSIDMRPFHFACDNGLKKTAEEVGLSYFEDALLDHESCNKLLNALTDIDAKLNRMGARTDVQKMKELFSLAVERGLLVGVYCD